jgi:hypothetical protein
VGDVGHEEEGLLLKHVKDRAQHVIGEDVGVPNVAAVHLPV